VDFFLCSDPQPGPDDQRSNQVATNGVTSADDLNLPGEYRCLSTLTCILNSNTNTGRQWVAEYHGTLPW